MKKLIFTIAILFLSLNVQGQLRGSGKVITRTFNLTDFDNLQILDFDGSVDIQVGKPYGIEIEIDENLESRLQVKKDKDEKLLIVSLEGNKNGRLYLENTRIKIKINMPELSSIIHRGNTNVEIKNISARFFRLKTIGNGSVNLLGKVEELDINKIGNGNVNAQTLLSKTAKVRTLGNGNVHVNSLISLNAVGSGNGNVIQTGSGKIDATSGIMGNGEVKKQ